MPSLGWHFVQTMAAAWLPLWQSFQAVLQLVAQPLVMTCNVFSLQIPKCAHKVLQNRQASNWDHMPEFLQRQLWDFAASWVSIPWYHDIPCHSRAPNAKFAFSNRDLKVLCKHRQKSLRSRPAATEGLWFWQFVEFSLEDMNMPSPEPTKTTSSKQILLSCRLSAARGTH